MASTKVLTVIENDVTLTAAAGDDTSTGVDLQDGYGATVYIKLTNGATGPTIAAQVQLEASGDDTNYYSYGGPLVGSVSNSAVSSWAVEIPFGVEFIRSVSGSNTGQDVTVRVELDEVTAV